MAKYYKAYAEKEYFSREIFRFASEIKKVYLTGEIEKRNQSECRTKLNLPTMQKINEQYGGLLFKFFLQIKSGAKSVEFSFYFYFARNLFSYEIVLSKNEPWNQRLTAQN